MTDYIWDATADGDADVSTNWSPNGVPGASDTVTFRDDYSTYNCNWNIATVAKMDLGTVAQEYNGTVTAGVTHTITELNLVNGAGEFHSGYVTTVSHLDVTEGTLHCLGDIAINDVDPTAYGGSHVVWRASANTLDLNGTALNPKKIYSTSARPTYPIRMMVYDSTPEVRSWDFSYRYWRGACAFLGNDTYPILFNTGDMTSNGIIHKSTPLYRVPKLDVHYIEGRAFGRVYREGGNAGTVTVQGRMPTYSFQWDTINLLIDSGQPCAFINSTTTVPRGHIESFRADPKLGSIYTDFNMTIVEAH